MGKNNKKGKERKMRKNLRAVDKTTKNEAELLRRVEKFFEQLKKEVDKMKKERKCKTE